MSAGLTYSAEVCRLSLCAVLGLAAGAKILNIRRFREAIGQIILVSRSGAHFAAGAVIVVEALIAALLATDAGRLVGSVAASFLFAGLTALVGRVVITGESIDCNCFGGEGDKLSMVDLFRNIALLAASLFVCVQDTSPRMLNVGEFVDLSCVGLVIAAILANLTRIIGLLAYRPTQ